MAERKVPIQLRPGVIHVNSEYAAPGRFIDMDKVRFSKGLAEKIKGWVATGWLNVTGVPRSSIAWQSIDGNKWVATGSAQKLELLDSDGDTLTNITPIRDSGSLGNNPFDMTDGSTTVVVNDTAHGAEQGDFVTFAGATAAGGITIDGEYTVDSVIDDNSFNITHSAAATSTVSGGGGSVTYSYAISNGELNSTTGGGWGVGTWGTGTWGTERTGGDFLQLARRWALDTYGEDLLALPVNNGTLYRWDKSAGGRAAVVANAPTGNFMFVTSERAVVILGADGNPMGIDGSDDEDLTLWTPQVTNKAFSRVLQTGNRLVAGTQLGQGVNLIWSDTTVYLMQFQNNNTVVYSTRAVGLGDDYGLIGSAAFIVVGGIAYWMSSTDFKMFSAAPSRMPNADDVRDFVYNDINITQAQKIIGRYDPINHEVWWHYPTAGSDENDRYVMFATQGGEWCTGTMARVCFVTQTEQGSKIFGFDLDGVSYEHEVGVDDNGSALAWYLETGYSDIDDGNVSMDVFAFIPDFERHSQDITVTLSTLDYPTDTQPLDTEVITLPEGVGIEDTRVAGRQLKFRMAGSAVGSDFRLGRTRLEINESGER